MRGSRREMALMQSGSEGGAYPFGFCKGLKEKCGSAVRQVFCLSHM